MKNFNISALPEEIKQSMIASGVWNVSCPVPIERLMLLEISHYDFSGNLCNGSMVVLDKMTQQTIKIFQELLIIKFPINKMCLLDKYQGNDELSMKDNNSSCFNYRLIANSEKISMHALGLAIDINPAQNPCLIIEPEQKFIEILPKAGASYLNRHNQRPGMVEPVVNIFKQNGYDIWGGNWNSPIDYHHFQVDRSTIHTFLL